MGRFRYIVISVVCVLMCACARKATVCGVAYEGRTPWELAAAIDAREDTRFVPESVQSVGQTKAYIIGWSLPSEKPDTIFCDLHNGKVVHAMLLSSTIEE